MFIYLVIVIIILGILSYLSSATFKGKMGENMVASQAKRYLGEEYVLLNNCTFSDQDNGTTQIDHILLSPYGVFVIETKNYTGWIFGSINQKQWTQKIYKKSYRFQNPIHQNYKHMKVLEYILSDIVQAEYLHSVIVFTPRSEFKTTMPAHVCRGKEWIEHIKNFQQVVISPMKLKRIKYRLEKEVLESNWKTERLHVRNLDNKQSSSS